jgi:Protein of unknown function (DUF3224)
VKRIVFGLAVIGAALVAAQVATSAPSRVHVSGTYTVTDFGALSCAPNGSPFVLRCTTTRFVSQYSGDLTGTSVANFEQIIDCKNGRTHGQGTETFTGSIAGVGSGTLTWGIHFDSAFDCGTFAVSDFSGRGDITSGTGDLAGLNGSIQFGIDTYDGELH